MLVARTHAAVLLDTDEMDIGLAEPALPTTSTT